MGINSALLIWELFAKMTEELPLATASLPMKDPIYQEVCVFYHLFRLLRFACFTIDFMLVSLFTFACACLPLCINRRFMPKLFQIWSGAFLRFTGIECHIHQRYNPPLPKRYVLISNHPSGADILILNALFQVHPLAKDTIRAWWIIGRIAASAGAVFVKRDSRDSRNAAKQQLIDSAMQGYNLLIYPEGGCFGRHLRPFKYGAFDIALAAGIPILPVYFQYEAENDFEWGEYGMIHHVYNLCRVCNKHAHCYIFDPVFPDAFGTPEAFSDYVHKLYEQWEAKYRLPL